MLLSLPFLAISFFFISVVGSFFVTSFFQKIAKHFHIWDDPKSNPLRKKQHAPIPLLGGTGPAFVAIFFMSLLWLLNKYNPEFTAQFGINLEPFRLYWVLVAILILIIGGFLDDKLNIRPHWQVIPITAALLVTIFLGEVRIEALSYPFNSLLPHTPFLPEIITFIWLGFCIAATKFLDGHDGLVTTVGIVSMLTIGSVSLFSHVNQPLIFLFTVVWLGVFAGFLPFNFPNAKMYLGEGGSEIIGFVIGFLSILSGAKIATAGTVIGWFIIDLVLVWLLRILDRRNPLTSGDRLHWHFRLVDLGLSKVRVLVITTLILLVTAHAGLLFGTQEKLWLIGSQIVWVSTIFIITFSLSRFLPARKK